MALNFQPELTDPKELRNNLVAVERHIDDDHYVRSFTPGEFVLLTATHLLDPVANDWPWIEMADATTSHAAVSFRKPSEWRSGRMRLCFWYTSDGASTNNFRILLSVRATRDAEVTPGTALLFNTSSYAGPAVAWTLIRSAYVYTTTSFGSDDELFSIRVVRLGTDGADNNVNDFYLSHLEVKHLPAVQVSQ